MTDETSAPALLSGEVTTPSAVTSRAGCPVAYCRSESGHRDLHDIPPCLSTCGPIRPGLGREHDSACPNARLCIVHACGQPAEIEVIWEPKTCIALGWPDAVTRTRHYCRACFDDKKVRHPWDSADIVRRFDPVGNNGPSDG